MGIERHAVVSPAEQTVVGLSKRYPNLVQFTEPVRGNDFSAFTKRDDIELAGWSDLAPYDVGHIAGWKIVERNIPVTRSVMRTKNVTQLMRLLDAGRIDIAIVNRWGGMSEAQELGVEGIRAIEPPLATKQMYFYLHRKHEYLVPRASRALKEMKEDGTWQRIYDEKVIGYFDR